MTSARVAFVLNDDLLRRTGQRAVIVDREGVITYHVDRAELAADPDGVFELMGRHGTALCDGGRYVPAAEEQAG